MIVYIRYIIPYIIPYENVLIECKKKKKDRHIIIALRSALIKKIKCKKIISFYRLRMHTKNTKEQKPRDAHVIFFTGSYEFVACRDIKILIIILLLKNIYI